MPTGTLNSVLKHAGLKQSGDGDAHPKEQKP